MRWLAYAAYLAGSVVFLTVALQRDAPLVAAGSALFVLGTVLYMLQERGRTRRQRSRR